MNSGDGDRLAKSEDDCKLSPGQAVILKLELASLKKFAFIQKSREQKHGLNNLLLFFTPCEEFNGGSMFSMLAENYRLIQPFVENINEELINHINMNIKNIHKYMRDFHQEDELSEANMAVNMFQDDILGKSAIDYAFEQNSIFSIKLFMKKLLDMQAKEKFKNCFDKAFTLMIAKGIDAKELVSSQLMYPSIWKEKTIFSHT